MKITNSKSRRIEVEVQTGVGHRVTVEMWLWAARELEEAVEAGMPLDTEVKIHNPIDVSGYRISAAHTHIEKEPVAGEPGVCHHDPMDMCARCRK